MECAWHAAASILGLAFGLHFGRVFAAIHAYWESAAVTAKTTIAIVVFLLGGGGGIGGTALFNMMAAHSGALYLLGMGLGLIASFWSPRLPPRYTIKSVVPIIRLSDALREALPDVRQRAVAIVTQFVPPKATQRAEKIDVQQLAAELEQAADLLSQADDQGDQGMPPSEAGGNDA